jgi:hypothetical protein
MNDTCICTWELSCAGTRILRCEGCGGDLCVCAACPNSGEIACPGCEDCCEPEPSGAGEDEPDAME